MAITGELITFFIVVFGAIAGVWWRVEAKIEAAKAKAEEAASSLEKYKTYVAESYVSKQGLREVRDEIMSGVREIKGSVEHITDRLDRVFEASKQTSRRAAGQQ